MEEIWRDIKGYESIYKISNLGKVLSIKRHGTKGGILKPADNGNGYLIVGLCKNKNEKTFKIHRLVAETFIPNPKGYKCVNHIKEFEKTNNCVSNLEWCTNKYNTNYGTCRERSENNHKKEVFQYDKNLNLIKKWNCIKDCEIENFDTSSITKCCKNKRKTHKGFIWKYHEIGGVKNERIK